MKSFFITLHTSWKDDSKEFRLPWWTIASLVEEPFEYSSTGMQTVIGTVNGKRLYALETQADIEKLVNEAIG